MKNEALRETILEQLEEIGVDLRTISIKIEKGPVIVLDGEVCSHKEKNLVVQTIIDSTGIKDIEDYMAVMEGIHEDIYDENGIEVVNEDNADQEDDAIGTEDIHESVEDGVPYIPPTNPAYREPPKDITWKKKKRKTR